jgi:hypothetical protein
MATALETKLSEAERRAHGLENMFCAARALREAQVPAAGSTDIFRELLGLDGLDAMRRHIREATGTPTGKRTYTPAVRKLLATEGKARPDGSYPIRDAQDVSDAVDDFNRADGSDADREHIIARAKAVANGTDALPADWAGSTKKQLQESAAGLRQAGPRKARTVEELAQWGIPVPTPDGACGAVHLREASSVDDLARFGLPVLNASPLAGQRPSELPAGIPVLPEAPGASALRRVPLTESVTGSVVRRVA